MEPPERLTGPRRRSGSGRESPSNAPFDSSSFQGNISKMSSGTAPDNARSVIWGRFSSWEEVWDAGSKQVKQAFSFYGNIDLLRPYFDVEPKQVRNRLFQSFVPRRPSTMQVSANDLYGPLMLIFTLCAILLYAMKTSGVVVKDGTLMGTAFGTCFGYWFFTSLAVYTMAYVFSTDISIVQTFSMLGYALFGHCLVLALTTLFHPAHEHLFFYALVALLAGPSCMRLVVYFAYKTPEKSHKLILAAVITMLHIGFLLYLHFGYHSVVEEIVAVFEDQPQIIAAAPKLHPETVGLATDAKVDLLQTAKPS